MRHLLNTLFVFTQGACLRLDHDTVRVDADGQRKLQIPLLHLGGIWCFGDVMLTSGLLHRCAREGCSVVLLTRTGRFCGRLAGPVKGNVLLRRAQHEALQDTARGVRLARNLVAGKLQNSRQILLRGGREGGDPGDTERLRAAADALAGSLRRLESATTLDHVRGVEGEAARTYFELLPAMVRTEREAFQMKGRSRRPPRDRMNALLSFLYTLLLNDCVAALEGVGLDPQVGYLHCLRPGRPALGLDLEEELRSVLADRLALTLVNRRQLLPGHFEERPGGAFSLAEEGRRAVVAAYQRRKQDEVHHPVLDRPVPLGLVPFAQARLLARFLRGDLPDYVPFLYR